MSWEDFYRRRDLIDAVLDAAKAGKQHEPPWRAVPEAIREFGGEERLLLALQYKWSQVLGGRLRVENSGPEDAGDPRGGKDDTDQVDAVARAWLSAERDNATLRGLLDSATAASPALRAANDAELRMLAITAGLAEPGEPDAEVTEVGNAFVALLRERRRHPGQRPARKANPLGQLLRALAPTA
ncbi:hypothetical protein BAY61_07425 [Prauserella marina]|uniref:hypothetical protein n=1 Tax=Prauserella marina TaxID=530584 RepID=UPI000B866E7E|nr:hypothetical protein [Prauserella marina]ASR39068.1 hypothetical protein BAY61_07425 [Prauserella marina]